MVHHTTNTSGCRTSHHLHHQQCRVRSILSSIINVDADIDPPGKRSFSEYQVDSLKERMGAYTDVANITPATHPVTRISPRPRKELWIHPTAENKARQRAASEARWRAEHPSVARRIGGAVTTIYGRTFSTIRSIWGYFTQQPPPPQEEELIAVATDSSGKKRRAVSSPQPSKRDLMSLLTALMAPATQKPRVMPGAFPSEPEPAPQPTANDTEKLQNVTCATLPDTETADKPTAQPTRQLTTPPDSRPASSHGSETTRQPRRKLQSRQKTTAPVQTLPFRTWKRTTHNRLPVDARIPNKKSTLKDSLKDSQIDARLEKAKEVIESPQEAKLSWSARSKQREQEDEEAKKKAAEEEQAHKKALEEEEAQQKAKEEHEAKKKALDELVGQKKVEERDPDDPDNWTDAASTLEKQILIRPLPPAWATKVRQRDGQKRQKRNPRHHR